MQAGHRVRALRGFLPFVALTLGSPAPGPATGFATGQDPKPIPPHRGFAPLPHVEARLLFVYFPQAPAGRDSLLPAWSTWLVEELTAFVRVMSRGQQVLSLEITKRPGADSTKAWRAPNPAVTYQANDDYGLLNNQIMQIVHDTYPPVAGVNYWDPVNMVFVITYESPFFGGRGGGFDRLGWVDVPGFLECGGIGCMKRGETQRLFTFDSMTSPTNDRVAQGAAHEYGHILFANSHSPYTGWPLPVEGPGTPPGQCHLPPVTEYVNMGRYDLLKALQPADSRPNEGLVPFHPVWLMQPEPVQAGFAWVPVREITSDTRGLRIPEIRGPQGTIFKIVPANSPQHLDQYFIVANYQGAASSIYDAKLLGTGLLVWHVLPDRAWDLESAWGKRPGLGVAGRDTLESDWCYEGFAGDFFTDSPPPGLPMHVDFGPGTNPNTNLYSEDLYTSAQSVRTSVAIENIRRDPFSTDMLADIYLSPKQYVVTPNGGEFIASGQNVIVTWLRRDVAKITSVDVALSFDGGLSYPLVHSALPNTGSHDFGGLGGTSDRMRFRVTSHDSLAVASDVSDTTFAVWDILESSVLPSVSKFCRNGNHLVKLDVSWQTSVPTDRGSDKLDVFFPTHSAPCAGTPSSTKSGGSGGTNHRLVWQGVCQRGVFKYRLKSKKATGETVSDCRHFTISSCRHCPENDPNDGGSTAPTMITSAPVEVFLRPTNPVHSSCSLEFGVDRPAQVSLIIYDVAGRRVRILAQGRFETGVYAYPWDLQGQGGGELAAGIYFAKLTVGSRIVTKKVLVAK